MHPRFALIQPFLLALSCFALPAHAADKIVNVDISGAGHSFSWMLVSPEFHKLYAGQKQTYDGANSGIFVFDVTKLGDVTESDERAYPCVATTDVKAPLTSVNCIALSPDRTKLYFGIDYANYEIKDTLVVYNLDAKGEPTGKARSYKSGNPHFVLEAMAVHPKTGTIYTTGWGGPGVYAMPVKNGEPTGTPVATPVGGQGKYSFVPNERFNALFLGTYPSIVETVNISPGGEVEGPTGSYKASETAEYLIIRRVGRFIYYAQGGKLWCWPFTADLEATGEPKPVLFAWDTRGLPKSNAALHVFRVHATKTDLYVALGEAEKDAKEPRPLNFRIVRFKPDAKGDIGNAEFVSEPDSKTLVSFTVDETTGVIYTSAR